MAKPTPPTPPAEPTFEELMAWVRVHADGKRILKHDRDLIKVQVQGVDRSGIAVKVIFEVETDPNDLATWRADVELVLQTARNFWLALTQDEDGRRK